MDKTEVPFDVAGPIPDPAEMANNAVDAVMTVTERFIGVIAQFIANLSWENVLLQLGLVALSLLVGWFVSKRINLALDKFDRCGTRKGLMAHLKHFACGFLENISFSFIGASILALGCYVLVVGMQYPATSMVIARITYSLLYAYALLSLILTFLQGILGQRIISAQLRRYVSMIFWGMAVLQFFGIMTDVVEWLDGTMIPIGDGKMTIWMLVVAVMSVLLTLGVANWLSSLVNEGIEEMDSLSPNIKVVLARVIRVTFLVLAVIIGLGTVGVDLTILSVFGGAVGVGLGFGLQKIASNYISGFIILLDKSIKIGDLVTVGGFQGRISAINTRYTVVRDNSGVENVVPNENFVTSAVLNHSFTEESTLQKIDISVAYDADVKAALAIMLEEANRARPRIDTRKTGWASLTGFGDSGINLQMGFWVLDPANGVGAIKTEISLALLKRFGEANIEIPYNMLEINFRKNDAGVFPVKNVTQ